MLVVVKHKKIRRTKTSSKIKSKNEKKKQRIIYIQPVKQHNVKNNEFFS